MQYICIFNNVCNIYLYIACDIYLYIIYNKYVYKKYVYSMKNTFIFCIFMLKTLHENIRIFCDMSNLRVSPNDQLGPNFIVSYNFYKKGRRE